MQQHLGVAAEVLPPAEVHARWPHLTPDRLIGATYCATDGFLRPHILLDEGYRRARELGVEVLTKAEVLGATLRGGHITALDTTRGPIEAEWYVNASNAWAPRVSRRIGGMPLPIRPTKRYLYHARQQRPLLSEEDLSRQPMTIYGLGEGRGAHTRPNGPLLVLAWAHETAPEPDFNDEDQDRIDPDFSHNRGLENFGYAILAQMADFAPDLADALGLTATTSGFYAVTPDADPLIGHDTQQENLLHAAGFSGHGLMHAPITAFLIEALLAGDVDADGTVRLPPPFERHAIDLATFDPARDFTAHSESMVL
jgi:glycine/D-amino acid oxidase-like deaminating enzyme